MKQLASRRQVLRILAVGGAAGAAWRFGLFGGLFGGLPRHATVTRQRVLMGTGVHLTLLGDDREAAEAAADAALLRMSRLEGQLSRYLRESELSRLNAEGRLDDASDELLEVLALARRMAELGDGAFDVTVQPLLDLYRSGTGLPAPARIEATRASVDYRGLRVVGRTVSLAGPSMAITLDGIGKGYVIDRGVEALTERGFGNVFVEAGGDLVAAGRKPGATPWRVGIRHPRKGLSLQARFDAENRAVATSGDYMQPFTADFSQHHILDPRTGASAPELASSTVLAPDGATADALATLTMVLGPRRSLDLVEATPGWEAYMVGKDLSVTRTSGFRLA